MRLDHGSLLVSDVERSVRFYTGALGLTEVPRPPTFEAPGAWLAIGETQQLHLVGEGEPGRTREMNPPWDPAEVAIGYANHLAFHVEDLDAALERAREHGVEPAGEVFARGDGVRRTFVTDPDGHVIELMETGVPVTGSEPTLRVPRRSGST
jgi:catechol 2,3-dioxygenase-like lactoylglutathione lyase family enzyme